MNIKNHKIIPCVLLASAIMVHSLGEGTKLYPHSEIGYMGDVLRQRFKDEYFDTFYQKLHPDLDKLKIANFKINPKKRCKFFFASN